MMRYLRGTNRLLAVPLLLLAVALAVIGTLQYRWLNRVAEAERERMRGNLEFAAERLAEGLSEELNGMFRAFLAPEDGDVGTLLEEWRRDARHPDLISAIYVVDRHGDDWSIDSLDLKTLERTPATLPGSLEPLRRQIVHVRERGANRRFPGPLFASIPALFIVGTPPRVEADYTFIRPSRIFFLQLDRRVLGTLLRTSADVEVELAAGGVTLFRSPGAAARPADFTYAFRPLVPRREGPEPPPPRRGREPGPARDESWQLGLSYRGGGLAAAVAAAHRRNLAVASLVLLLLAAASALLIALLRRGERLREQQAQFVAAMSHELNTPLAILRVASENLNDGIVQDPEKVSRYVRTITRETARLSEMVSHVLELAGMNAGAAVLGREDVDISTVVQEAVAQSRWMAGPELSVDVDVAPDLPHLRGDERALTRVVQNLVANAIRHAGAGKWVGVRATRDDGFVRIVVEDRGPGIDAADAGHVFEPFYRGRNSGNVRGTGLGLTIVRQIIADHGGSVTVERGRPAGAAFIVRLPVEVES